MDKYRLEYEMRKQGVSMSDLAHKLGMSRSTLYRKLNGITEFTLGEIQDILDYLGLDSPAGIFFKKEVS
ncbi:helix-turn-helix domain-containing protein [Faecalibaculum rodentium]|uniref:helix-turn-helix domain-containing protein n=1 Tax=Faecalibaculum rodentium TaxID=1702221 RepID=UPI0023F3E189|nr:helix-turn-helix transcriptional regulator [Faecalibaculum rodentium]